MVEHLLHVERDNLAVKLDMDNNILLAYDCVDIDELCNEGILKEVGLELGSKISQYFKIDVENYGVDIVCENLEFMDRAC